MLVKHWKSGFQDLGYYLSNYIPFLKILSTYSLSDFEQPKVHFWPNLEMFCPTSPNCLFFRKINLSVFSLYGAVA